MKATPVPFDSEALRVNLATTAQEVVIPDRYLPLLEAVDGLHGVRSALAETMGEYFHRFRNPALLVDGLQTTLLRNWAYFERSPRRAELFGLLGELAVGLLETPLTEEQFSDLLRALLTWSADVLRGPSRDEYDEPLVGLVAAFARLLPDHEAEFLERDTLLHNLTQRAQERPGWRPPASPSPGRCSRPVTAACVSGSTSPPGRAPGKDTSPIRPASPRSSRPSPRNGSRGCSTSWPSRPTTDC